MKSTTYSDKVLEHFKNPRNVGEIEDADGIGRVGNPVCGDLMWIYLRIAKNEKGEEIISDIKFKTFGCGSAVSTSSMITEMAKGMTLDEAYKITRQNVADELDGLPPIKMHCSNLAADALKAAIDNYRLGTEPEIEIVTSCQLDVRIILGIDDFLGKGVYKEVPADLEEFREKRIIIVDSGDESLELALKLTEYTGRVIVVTSAKSVPGTVDLRRKLKHSDVKLLQESELIEIKGELDEVEKIVIHDFDEDENYELFVDVVIVLD
ncbi:MAG: Fe-S cluster assembly scaffold protein NifU [Promethearchaeota archaeon Loki_b31]|nr:MAG: Fe-S cluster assembly scaffold protein NifU [Candidatus Lokiarchaeota archaeon Loki_b31]